MIIIVLIVAVVFLSILLGAFAWYNWKFARVIFQVEDAIETSLDVLDRNFMMLSKIAKKEIFFDSPEVRQAIQAIQDARDAVLFVANVMGAIDEAAIEDSEEN